jgi:hypothetical protein
MRSSHNNSAHSMHVVNAVIAAADACDPVALNDFFSLAIDANLKHLELIDHTLPLSDSLKRHNAVMAGSLLLGLFNHFYSRKLRDGLGVDQIKAG